MSLLDKLTKVDYETIIKKWLKKEDVGIVQHSIRPLSEKVEGFLGDHHILKISVLDDGKVKEHSFFIKTSPYIGFQSEVITRIHGFERESDFFKLFVNKFENIIPGYRATFSPKFFLNKENKVLVFEDLAVNNYCLAKTENINEMDLPHVKLVLNAVAKLHAGSLIYEEIKTKQLGTTQRLFYEDEGIYTEEHFRKEKDHYGHIWMKSGVKGLRALLDVVSDTKITGSELEQFYDTSCDIIADTSKFRKVLGHNDLWHKNILFKYTKDNVPLKANLVDYQMIRYFPPVHDIVFFIVLNSKQQVKEQYFGYLLKYYHDCLSDELRKYDLNPDEVLPFSEIKESTEVFLPAIKLKVAIYITMLCANDEYVSFLAKDEAKFREFMLGDRGPFCRVLFDSDSYYRGRLASAISDLATTIRGDQTDWEKI